MKKALFEKLLNEYKDKKVKLTERSGQTIVGYLHYGTTQANLVIQTWYIEQRLSNVYYIPMAYLTKDIRREY